MVNQDRGVGQCELISESNLLHGFQLTVYNPRDESCPTYRCIFPKPPPAEAVTTCSEAGVLGPAVGVIGSLQAMCVLQLLLGLPTAYQGKMLVFDGLNAESPFRMVKLRKRGPTSAIDPDIALSNGLDYGILDPKCASNGWEDQPGISAEEYLTEIIGKEVDHILLDVRDEIQYEIAHIAGSTSKLFEHVDPSFARNLRTNASL